MKLELIQRLLEHMLWADDLVAGSLDDRDVRRSQHHDLGYPLRAVRALCDQIVGALGVRCVAEAALSRDRIEEQGGRQEERDGDKRNPDRDDGPRAPAAKPGKPLSGPFGHPAVSRFRASSLVAGVSRGLLRPEPT